MAKLLGWIGNTGTGTPIWSVSGGGAGGIIFSVIIILAIPTFLLYVIGSLVAYPFRATENAQYVTHYNQVLQVQQRYMADFEAAGLLDVQWATETNNQGFADEYSETYPTQTNPTTTASGLQGTQSLLVALGQDVISQSQVSSDEVISGPRFYTNRQGQVIWDLIPSMDESHLVGPNSGNVRLDAYGAVTVIPSLQAGDAYSMVFAKVMGLQWDEYAELWYGEIRNGVTNFHAEELVQEYNRCFGTTLSLFSSTKEELFLQATGEHVKTTIDTVDNTISADKTVFVHTFSMPQDYLLCNWLFGDFKSTSNPEGLSFWFTADSTNGFKEYFDARPVSDAVWQELVGGTYLIE